MTKYLKKIARRLLRPPLHKADVSLSYTVFGTDYGGWPLLDTGTPQEPLIYSFGVGEDLSFDLAAIERYNATVHAFDPTPRSKNWVERQSLPGALHYHPIGLGAEDGEADFFAPEIDAHVSFSAQPASLSNLAFAVRARISRLSTIIADLDTGVPDVLKMDIEGFEYAVLDDLIASDIRPKQLLIEFHHRMYGIPNNRTREQISRLHAAGYAIFHVSSSGHEYGLVHCSTRKELS